MIPHSLFIKNFLSYGNEGQTISFDPYHLICLSGKNGHGKSALLDAITWALWGQARKTLTSVKPDQGLLRLGQSHMMVIFEFSCNGRWYRIRREYMHHHSKPYAQLEFGLLEGEKLIPLTDKTIKATQQCIISTLKLDFEAFTNTVFLRQGSANEFSKKSAKERKDLLATILGIDTYEQVRKLALQKIRAAQLETTYINNLILRLSDQIVLLDPNAALYNAQELELKTVLVALENATTNGKQLEQQKKIFYAEEQKLQQYRQQFNLITKKKNDLIATVKTLYYQWRTTRKQLQHIPDKKILLIEKNDLVSIIEKHQKEFARSLQYKEQLLALHSKKQIVEQQARNDQFATTQALLKEKYGIEKDIQQLLFLQTTSQAELAALENEFEDNKITIEQMAYAEQSLIDIQKMGMTVEKNMEKRKATYQFLIAKGNLLTAKLKEYTAKTSTTYDIENPSCPLCEQNLSLARKKFLRTKFEKEIVKINHQLKRISTIVPILKELLISQHSTYVTIKNESQKCEVECAKLKELFQRNTALEMHIKEKKNVLVEQMKEQAIVVARLALWEKQHSQEDSAMRLQHDPIYQEILKQIASVEDAITQSSYNQQEYQASVQKLENVNTKIELYENSHLIKEAQQQTAMTIHTQIREMKQYKKELLLLAKSIQTQEATVDSLNVVVDQINEWQSSYEHLHKQKELLIRSTTTLRAQIDHADTLKKERTAMEKTLHQCAETIADYSTIATAMGKDGIQALLIEEAIPEIEAEANSLLARLTNNNSRIFIESLKDLKSGGTKETLDIKISDHVGIRPYDMFSGGEAFRIDFALRIAISKLVARRAGTALQTLIIDEGFGSQDEEGLHNITEALYKIKDYFAKIIIVSHLPTMKDNFPVHFMIEKKSQGSCLKVVELG